MKNRFDPFILAWPILVGSATEMGVAVYSRDGKLKRVVRTEDEPTVLTSGEIQAESTRPAAGTDGGQTEPVRVNAVRPMYERMSVDGRGRVWLLTNRIRGGDERWVVFDSDGRLTASLRLIEDPAAVPPPTEPWFGPKIVRFGVDEVVVLDQDESGAMRLSFYEITGW
jgi:hypothetical protein